MLSFPVIGFISSSSKIVKNEETQMISVEGSCSPCTSLAGSWRGIAPGSIKSPSSFPKCIACAVTCCPWSLYIEGYSKYLLEHHLQSRCLEGLPPDKDPKICDLHCPFKCPHKDVKDFPADLHSLNAFGIWQELIKWSLCVTIVT